MLFESFSYSFYATSLTLPKNSPFKFCTSAPGFLPRRFRYMRESAPIICTKVPLTRKPGNDIFGFQTKKCWFISPSR